MVYLGTTPTYGSLASEFAWERTALRERDRRAAAEPLLHRLDRRTRWRLHLLPRIDMPDLVARHAHRAPVLDVGCGDGGALARLRPGFTPHGIEISPVLAARADEAFRARGGRAVCAPAVRGLHAFPEGHFTAIVLRSYLEHEIAPREVLRGVHRILCDGGIVLLKVPNYGSLNRRVRGARWCGFRHPDHVNYFTPRTLALMARDCGFMPKIGPTDAFPTSDNLWARLTRDPAAKDRDAVSRIPPFRATRHATAPQARAETSR
jgi:SAM-dependent methyltransferase